MTQFYQPDLGASSDNPFVRGADDKLIRRSYWLDLPDKSLILAMTIGIGANMPNDQKRAHLNDIGRSDLIDQICVQEVLPPER
jgi:hypothetical protein